MSALEGKKAPDFCLEGNDNRRHCLADYAGKNLVVYFYPRDNTSGCIKEACAFRDLHPQLAELDVALVGISRDSLASHDRFIAKFDLPFVLLSDPDAEVMQAYGAFGEKTMYGKKVLGTVRSTVVIGPDGIVLKHWPAVRKAETHPREVLGYLQALKVAGE
jgi:peroxiredoxin Q/BCP